MNEINILIIQIIITIISSSLHESAHAFTAWILGDYTCKNKIFAFYDNINIPNIIISRFASMNNIYIPLKLGNITYYPDNLYNKKIGKLLIAYAGPIMNLLIALITIYINKFVDNNMIYLILNLLIEQNIMFFAFNILPIPNLDGYELVNYFFPNLNIDINIINLITFVLSINYYSDYIIIIRNFIYKLI